MDVASSASQPPAGERSDAADGLDALTRARAAAARTAATTKEAQARVRSLRTKLEACVDLSERAELMTVYFAASDAESAALAAEKEALLLEKALEKEALLSEKAAAVAAATASSAAEKVAAVAAAVASTKQAAVDAARARRAATELYMFGLSASRFARHDGWSPLWKAAKAPAMYRCCRPVSSSPPPPALASAAFRTFYAHVDSDEPIAATLAASVSRLAAIVTAPMVAHETEVVRAREIRSVVHEMLKPLALAFATTSVGIRDGVDAITDGAILNASNRGLLNTEIKTFFGTGSDAYMQNVQYGVQLWREAKRPRHFPMFLLTFIGDCFRVDALWIDGDCEGNVVCAAPLTPFVPLGAHRFEARPFMGVTGAARVFRALCEGLIVLKDGGPTGIVGEPFAPYVDVPIMLSPTQRLVLTARLHDRLVYTATHVVADSAATSAVSSSLTYIVKFVQQYGYEAHERACMLGIAPRLYNVENIDNSGGWKYVVMQYLDPKDGWQRLDEISDAVDRAAAVSALKQAVDQFHSSPSAPGATAATSAQDVSATSNWVHGDLHQHNIMVKLIGTDTRNAHVMLLDFDWAGCAGKARYPDNMNHVYLRWGSGAVDGGLVTHDHDVFLIDRAVSGKGDLKSPPESPAKGTEVHRSASVTNGRKYWSAGAVTWRR